MKNIIKSYCYHQCLTVEIVFFGLHSFYFYAVWRTASLRPDKSIFVSFEYDTEQKVGSLLKTKIQSYYLLSNYKNIAFYSSNFPRGFAPITAALSALYACDLLLMHLLLCSFCKRREGRQHSWTWSRLEERQTQLPTVRKYPFLF